MIKIIGPLASHHASGHITAPKIYSTSLRNRHWRDSAPEGGEPPLYSLLFTDTKDACNAPTIQLSQQATGTIECYVNFQTMRGLIAGTLFGSNAAGANLTLYDHQINAVKNPDGTLYQTMDPAPSAINTWHHVAITWIPNNAYLWVNGNSKGSSINVPITANPHDGFHIGGQTEPRRPNIGAYICRVRFSDIVRYTTNFTPAIDFTPDANTIALWRMTEGSGTTVADESGNAHTLDFPPANQPTWSDLLP